MSDWDEIRRAVAQLPDVPEIVEEGDPPSWKVRRKSLLWERPLRKYEVAELGASMRDAPILAAMVEDVGERAALISRDPEIFFTTSHFADYPAVLIWLDRIPPKMLAEVVIGAWLVRAPAAAARAFLSTQQ